MPDQVGGEEQSGTVADGWEDADDGGPAKADTHEVEQGKVESVCGLAGFGEDFGVALRDVGGDLLLNFLGLAGLAGVGDLLVVRVLKGACLAVGKRKIVGMKWDLHMGLRRFCSCTCPFPWTAFFELHILRLPSSWLRGGLVCGYVHLCMCRRAVVREKRK